MRRQHGTSRLEGFSDGVFAFAATLLVVSLEVPRSLDELAGELFGFVGFSISFAALLAIWSVHNAYFRRYDLQRGWIVGLNGLLLLVVLFYVYPLKFIAGSMASQIFPAGGVTFQLADMRQLGELLALYGLGFVGIFLAVALMYRHAARSSDGLDLDAFELAEARYLARHYGLFVAVGSTSILFALLGVGLRIGFPGWIYFLIGPVCWWHGVWSERELGPLRAQHEP